MSGLSTTLADDLCSYSTRGLTPTILTSSAGLGLAGNLKASLHTSEPGSTGAGEANGGSYARQNTGYTAPTAGVADIAAPLSFTNLPAGTYGWYGIWDLNATPKLVMTAPLAQAQVIPSGATLQMTSAPMTLAAS